MIITIEQLKQILNAGGCLVIDASVMTFNQIRDLSTVAQNGTAKITVKNLSSMTAAQLTELAALAPGLIVFDLTS